MTEETGALQPIVETAHPKSKRKIVAVILVVLLIVSSMGLFVWYQYYRHWTVEDLMEAVVGDPGPGAPGFKHSLAGKTVTVEGKITNATTRETTLGNYTLIELDGEEGMPLVAWGDFDHEIGQKMEMEVSFEWSSYNDETHVFSPQVAFPNLFVVLPMQIVLDAVNYVAGGVDFSFALTGDGNMTVSVDWVRDPIPLSVANCSLRAGRGSWASDYVDMLGFYENNNETDYIRNMTSNEGDNGIMTFVDSNSDGYLDSDDYFELNGLPKPTTASGLRTYLFIIQWPKNPEWDWDTEPRAVALIIMKSEGALRYTYGEAPGARLSRSSIDNGTRLTITCLDGEAYWGDVTVQLSRGEFYSNFTELHPLTSDLTGLGTVTKSYEGLTLGNLTARCDLVDKSGNGRLDIGDSIALISMNSTTFDSGAHYPVSLIHEKTAFSICQGVFQYNVTPQSNITLTDVVDGVSLTFAPPYLGYNNTYEPFETPWDEILLVLSDGLNSTTWQPVLTENGMDFIITVIQPSSSLGNLTVFCNITDIEDNGYINRGDSVVFTTGGAETFSPSTIYNVTMKFNPTGGEIARTSFGG